MQKGGGSSSATRPKTKMKRNQGPEAASEVSVPARQPTSTFVSSPLRGTARRQKAISRQKTLLDGEDEEEQEGGKAGPTERSGYFKDGSVADSEDDYFEPPQPLARIRPRQRQRTLEELGPRISTDTFTEAASVNEIHSQVIDAFIEQARELEESIRNTHGLRRNLFTEQQYREMCISWATDVSKLRQISGINEDNVAKFGVKFARLLKQFHAQYCEMMGETRRESSAYPTMRTVSGNHDIVDLISSEGEDMDEDQGEEEEGAEEDSGPDEPSDDDEDEEDAGETANYSNAPSAPLSREVQEWHAKYNKIGAKKASPAKASSSRGGGSGSGMAAKKRQFGKRTTSRGKSTSSRGGSSYSSGGISKRKPSGGGSGGSGGSAAYRKSGGGGSSGSAKAGSSKFSARSGGSSASAAARRTPVNSSIMTMPT
jgi:bloom syndrome protein